MWSRVLLEKLIIPELVKKFDAFNGTWRLIPTVTRARHLSLSCDRSLSLICTVLLLVYFQNIYPGLGLCVISCNVLCLFGEEWLVPHPTIELENHPLFPVHNCLINTFSATLHIWRPSPQSTTWVCAMLWWWGHIYHCYLVIAVSARWLLAAGG